MTTTVAYVNARRAAGPVEGMIYVRNTAGSILFFDVWTIYATISLDLSTIFPTKCDRSSIREPRILYHAIW